MAIRKLDKSEWAPFFDRLSENISGEEVEVEVISLQAGDQIATDWVRLSGLTYDPKDDALDVFTASLDHRIRALKEIYVEQTGPEIQSIEAVDREDCKRIIKLRQPLMLAAAGSAA